MSNSNIRLVKKQKMQYNDGKFLILEHVSDKLCLLNSYGKFTLS